MQEQAIWCLPQFNLWGIVNYLKTIEVIAGKNDTKETGQFIMGLN